MLVMNGVCVARAVGVPPSVRKSRIDSVPHKSIHVLEKFVNKYYANMSDDMRDGIREVYNHLASDLFGYAARPFDVDKIEREVANE